MQLMVSETTLHYKAWMYQKIWVSYLTQSMLLKWHSLYPFKLCPDVNQHLLVPSESNSGHAMPLPRGSTVLPGAKCWTQNWLCTDLIVTQTLCGPRAGSHGRDTHSELDPELGMAKNHCSVMTSSPPSGESGFSSQLYPVTEKNANIFYPIELFHTPSCPIVIPQLLWKRSCIQKDRNKSSKKPNLEEITSLCQASRCFSNIYFILCMPGVNIDSE